MFIIKAGIEMMLETLDVVINFDIEHEEALKILYDEIGQVYPDYEL